MGDPEVEFFKTKVVKKTLAPSWNEQFQLRTNDGQAKALHVMVYDEAQPTSLPRSLGL